MFKFESASVDVVIASVDSQLFTKVTISARYYQSLSVADDKLCPHKLFIIDNDMNNWIISFLGAMSCVYLHMYETIRNG